MKVLMVSAHFDLPSDSIPIGGVQKHIRGVSDALLARGHHVMWTYPTPNVAPLGGGKFARVNTGEGLGWANWVVMHDYCSWHETPKPNLMVFHGWEGICPPPPGIVQRRQEIARRAGATIAVGAFIPKWYGHEVDAVIWGATDPPAEDEPQAISAPNAALWVGRLEPDTGCLESIRVAVRMGYKVHVYGDGSLRIAIERWRDDTPDAEVLLYGFMPDAARAFSVVGLALPSGYLSYLEALVRRKRCAVVPTNELKKDYWGLHPFPPDGCDWPAGIMPPEGWFLAWAWAREQTWDSVADLYERLLGKQ